MKIKKAEEPTDPREMPADFRCDLEAPRSTLIADAIALIEREGKEEPSAIKKHLMAYRRISWDSWRAGQGPNLLQQLQRADAKAEALRRECEPCPSCHRGPDAAKAAALKAARQERARLAEALAARHKLLDTLRGERAAALAQVRESAVLALANLVDRLGIPAMLRGDRVLYVSGSGYEEIPIEVIRRCGIAERAGALARRIEPTSGVGAGQVFVALDKELSAALRKRLDMTAGSVLPEGAAA